MEMLAISRIRDTEIATTPRIWKYKRITLFIFYCRHARHKKARPGVINITRLVATSIKAVFPVSNIFSSPPIRSGYKVPLPFCCWKE